MNTKSNLTVLAISCATLLGGYASAQQTPGLTRTSPNMPVSGNVPTLCAIGAVGGQGSFPLGVLIDTATGKMRPGLSAPDQSITGSWCNAPSSVSISATQLTAVNFTATPPTGFSRSLNYTATASGFSALPASFTTGATSNTTATRPTNGPITGPITIAVSAVTPVGIDPFLVADTAYQGVITITLAVQAISGSPS
jgi:hypothetical protein